jgi:hypothetical protein
MSEQIENLCALSAETLVTIATVPVRVRAHDLAVLQRSAAGEDVDLMQLAAAHEAIGCRMIKVAKHERAIQGSHKTDKCPENPWSSRNV